MKNYKKKIETIKDDIIDDIIKLVLKKGKDPHDSPFIIIDDDDFYAVRYKSSWRKGGDYKDLLIEKKHNYLMYYITDSKEGEVYKSHFDARLMDVDMLYCVLKTIKEIKPQH